MNGHSSANGHDENHVLPRVTAVTLTPQDMARLRRYERSLPTVAENLIFNDVSGTGFTRHREISYALKKARLQGYNREVQYDLQVRETPKPTVARASTNWSQVVQKGLAKNAAKRASDGTDNDTAIAAEASRLTEQDHHQSLVTSNALQPLGIVSLRAMFDPTITRDLFQVGDADKLTPRGLINSGNICYMNSVLQLLSHCAPFMKVLQLVHSKTMASLANSKTPLLDAMLLFETSFRNGINTNSPFAPDAFYLALSKHPRFSHLKWGQQEDAEEFLGYLLDGLHEEFVSAINALKPQEIQALIASGNSPEFKQQINNTVKLRQSVQDEYIDDLDIDNDESSNDGGWHEVGISNKRRNKIAARRTVEIKPSPITLLFGGQFRSVLEVPRQKEGKSITLDPFQHVQLDISDPAVSTLEDAFKLLSVPEMIPYKSSNGMEVRAKKQNFIDKLPNILIIHLKRFSFVKGKENDADFYRVEKLRKKIDYPHELAIPLDCISPEQKRLFQVSNEYRLIGVVYHHGLSSEGGHYTCDVTLPNPKAPNNWIRIDDGQFYEIDSQQVLSPDEGNDAMTAYILMYQKSEPAINRV